MCFSISQENKKKIQALIDKQLPLFPIEQGDEITTYIPSRYINAFNHPSVPVVLNGPARVKYAKWGLIPFWVKDEKKANELKKMTLNAKSETMYSLPSFKASAPKYRCLIPVDGFYEYQHQPDGKKVRYKMTMEDDNAFFLGGLWSTWNDEVTFTIVTMPSNKLMSEIHNSKLRMPVIIRPDAAQRWLDSYQQGDIVDLFEPDDSIPLVATKDTDEKPKVVEEKGLFD